MSESERSSSAIPKTKILILTASPKRDKDIDKMLAVKLTAMGNEVQINPCLREGRQAILQYQPDVVVVPPIRNPYARDLAETIKRFGCGCVTRHTEPSCDWPDFKRMDDKEKTSILGPFPYFVDAEIVWGPDEAEILSRRNTGFPVFSVGSFSADKYRNMTATDCIPKEELYKTHNLDLNKKTILILSAWGFADSAPDLNIDEITAASKDTEGRNNWLQMIVELHSTLKNDYNILVSLHPNIRVEPYKSVLAPRNIPLDIDCRAIDLIMNSDIIIHAGSTSALGSHMLNKVAFQHGDQNKKVGNWWDRGDSEISKVSPYCATVFDLIAAIKNCTIGVSNANPETIKMLEGGRYGSMDGHATDRAAEIIGKVGGKFKYFWPDLGRDYSQIGILKTPDRILNRGYCGVCNHEFFVVRQEWVDMFANWFKLSGKPQILGMTSCPHCGSRILSAGEVA